MQFLVVTNLGQNLSPVSLRSRPRSAKSQDSCTFLVVTNLGHKPSGACGLDRALSGAKIHGVSCSDKPRTKFKPREPAV